MVLPFLGWTHPQPSFEPWSPHLQNELRVPLLPTSKDSGAPKKQGNPEAELLYITIKGDQQLLPAEQAPHTSQFAAVTQQVPLQLPFLNGKKKLGNLPSIPEPVREEWGDLETL